MKKLGEGVTLQTLWGSQHSCQLGEKKSPSYHSVVRIRLGFENYPPSST